MDRTKWITLRRDPSWQHWSRDTQPILEYPPPPVPLHTWLKRLRLTAATPEGRLGDEVEKTLAGLADGDDKEVKDLFDEEQALLVRSSSDPTSRALHPLWILIAPRRC